MATKRGLTGLVGRADGGPQADPGPVAHVGKSAILHAGPALVSAKGEPVAVAASAGSIAFPRSTWAWLGTVGR